MADEDIIRLDLHGSKAPDGIDLHALQRFLAAFRAALRDFDRATSREDQVGRGGHPDARDQAVTAFRVSRLAPGSALLELVDASASDPAPGGLGVEVPGLASSNVRSLLKAVDRDAVPPAVIDSLDEARKALGADGRYGIKPHGFGRMLIDESTVARLRAATRPRPKDASISIIGRLHAIETEQPFRVEVRSVDGTNWACTYAAAMEPLVLSLVKSMVMARGVGQRQANARGTLTLDHIEGIADNEQSALFTFDPVPMADLEVVQGVQRAQGLAALSAGGALGEDELADFLADVLEG